MGRKREIIEELLRREKLKYYQSNPLDWLDQRFGEDRKSFHWSLFGDKYKSHQWDGDKNPIYNMWNDIAKGKGYWGALSAATGCHAKGTKILMYNGDVKNVENLVVGDTLMGNDSTQRKVLSLARGRELLYKVVPKKSAPFICNESHILSLKKTENSPKSAPNVLNISIKDYLKRTKSENRFYKLYTQEVHYSTKKVDFPPYFIGVCLANGSINSQKGIPQNYLINSKKIRLKLLAGIIDSIGTLSESDNVYTLSTIYQELKDDIVNLSISLGFQTNWKKVQNNYKSYYLIYISGNTYNIPVLLQKKKAKPRNKKKTCTLQGFKLEKLNVNNYYGFEIDGNHLYFLANGIITHNTSKTYFLSRLVFWFLDCFQDALIVTSAPKESQLKLHLWAEIGRAFSKFKTIRPEAKLNSLRLSLTDINEKNPYDGHQAVGFVAGVGAEEETSTKAQGFHRDNMLIICEETPGMNPAIMTAFKNTCTGEGNNIIVAVGNPDSELDELAQFSELKRVKNYRISAYDYPNVVLKRNVFPGAVGQTSINQRIEEYGEHSAMFKSRVRGISPKESSDSLIKLIWIDNSINAQLDDELYYYSAAGVDVANSCNGDKAAVCYGVGSQLLDIIEFKCPSASDIAYNLLYTQQELIKIRQDLQDRGKYAVREYLSAKDTNLTDNIIINDYSIPRLMDFDISTENVGIDGVGVGASTINTFTNLGYNVVSLLGGEKQWEEAIAKDLSTDIPLIKFSNLRAQMYWEAREDFAKGKISIRVRKDEDDLGVPQTTLKQLKKELTAIRFEMRSNAIAIEKKDKIIKRLGHSPNLADAFVYWNWMRKGYKSRTIGASLPFSSG